MVCSADISAQRPFPARTDCEVLPRLCGWCAAGSWASRLSPAGQAKATAEDLTPSDAEVRLCVCTSAAWCVLCCCEIEPCHAGRALVRREQGRGPFQWDESNSGWCDGQPSLPAAAGCFSGIPMRCAGATGGVGRAIVERLVLEGVQVSALVRDPALAMSRLPSGTALFQVSQTCRPSLGQDAKLPPSEGTHGFQGNVYNFSTLPSSLQGSDVLFIATGARPSITYPQGGCRWRCHPDGLHAP